MGSLRFVSDDRTDVLKLFQLFLLRKKPFETFKAQFCFSNIGTSICISNHGYAVLVEGCAALNIDVSVKMGYSLEI